MRKLTPIKLTDADIARFWSKVDKWGPNECWEWVAGRHPKGYGIFHDCHDVSYRAHRVAFAVTSGDTKLQVLHSCNNPPCCNPNHLYAGTQKDNIRQCFAESRGVFPDSRGERNGQTKLTVSEVHEIRALRDDGWLLREIAEEYGIHFSQVSYICSGKCWKHI